jgi:hypothetical protein
MTYAISWSIPPGFDIILEIDRENDVDFEVDIELEIDFDSEDDIFFIVILIKVFFLF